MRLRTLVQNEIHVLDMKDGDIAIITNWTENTYIGHIVTKFGKDLVYIGFPRDRGWPSLFTELSKERFPSCKVQILPPGTELVV